MTSLQRLGISHALLPTFLVKGANSAAYATKVRPRLEYSSTVWDPHHNRDFSLGTVSGSGTGPLDYGATDPVPDP